MDRIVEQEQKCWRMADEIESNLPSGKRFQIYGWNRISESDVRKTVGTKKNAARNLHSFTHDIHRQ